MDKRLFLATAGLAGLMPATAALAATSGTRSPGLLTVSGAVGKTNRGALDPVTDQMMAKHGIRFDKAFVFEAGDLQRLPQVTIRPTLEYDGKPHALKGPLLTSVLQAAGVAPGASMSLGLRAVDGYNAAVSLADAAAWRMVVATHIDGQPMALGGLGPQWAVYDADSLPAFKDKPLNERFAVCPWGLYHIDVKAA
jgi:hypothetical protein